MCIIKQLISCALALLNQTLVKFKTWKSQQGLLKLYNCPHELPNATTSHPPTILWGFLFGLSFSFQEYFFSFKYVHISSNPWKRSWAVSWLSYCDKVNLEPGTVRGLFNLITLLRQCNLISYNKIIRFRFFNMKKFNQMHP